MMEHNFFNGWVVVRKKPMTCIFVRVYNSIIECYSFVEYHMPANLAESVTSLLSCIVELHLFKTNIKCNPRYTCLRSFVIHVI